MKQLKSGLLLAAGIGLMVGGCSMMPGNHSSESSSGTTTSMPSTSYGAAAPAAGTTTQQQATTSSSSDNTSTASNSMSGSGQADPTVMQLQRALDSQGAHLSVDGVMGPNTQAALRNYQQHHGLQATGQIDQQTRDSLKLRG